MSRTVIRIQEEWEGSHSLFYLEEPRGTINGATKLCRLSCDATQPPYSHLTNSAQRASVVREVGDHLYQALTSHPAVRSALDQAVAIARSSSSPIYFWLHSAAAEALPWEALCHPSSSFLALDSRWPIGRLAESSENEAAIERHFEPPLIITAVISAAGISGDDEWDALYDVFSGTPFDVKLHVAVSEQGLKQRIENLNEDWIDVSIVGSKSDLLDLISRTTPNVLHFFCHGSTDLRPHLQVATVGDWVPGAPPSHFSLEPSEIADDVNFRQSAWLVSLNCCRGAAPGREVASLARMLVQAGLPAVVGMREPIDSGDASLFCRWFYKAVLDEIGTCLQGNELVTDIEWARSLQKPRRQLCERHASNVPLSTGAQSAKEWTLPAMYLRPEPFRLRRHSTNDALSYADRIYRQSQLEKLQETLDLLESQPDAPAEVKQMIELRISDLKQQLYPDQ